MKDIIYIPLGTTNAMRKSRTLLAQELVGNGWQIDGCAEFVENMDLSHKQVIKVAVLTRPIGAKKH